MFGISKYKAMIRSESGGTRTDRRRCLPAVARLEDRGLLSTIAAHAHVAPMTLNVHGPIVNQTAHVVHSHTLTSSVAHRAGAAHPAARTIHFPGGSVTVGHKGTRVIFPGGGVLAGRRGAIVRFPGGFVVAGFRGVVVKFPGGFISI